MQCVRLAHPADLDGFARHAAALLAAAVPPADILWRTDDSEADLFGAPAHADAFDDGSAPPLDLSPFRAALLHRDPGRFALIYRLLHRRQCQPNLLAIASDRDVQQAELMARAVRRDMHKMRAFLRFRDVEKDTGGEAFVAWFEPEHHILAANTDFFIRRFATMDWTIVTPDATAIYQGGVLTWAAGGRKSDVPADDAVGDAWKIYFQSIFNPARLKIKAMQKEMPKKYWKNMPETALVAPLIRSAQTRTQAMIVESVTPRRALSPFRPAQPVHALPGTLAALQDEVRACRRCPLHCHATQAVCGEGPVDAAIMVVAEQPGDAEDVRGAPLVGPAGRVFDEALMRVQLARSALYVTNAVKHFKFEPRGKRRIHAKPDAAEIAACNGWLQQEIAIVRPRLIVAMGATALRGLTGRNLPVTSLRGTCVDTPAGLPVFVTVHPSYMLRLPDRAQKAAAWRAFLHDWSAIAQEARGLASAAGVTSATRGRR